MGMYRKEWSCCNSATETDAWEPQDCPFCAPQPERTWVGLTDDEIALINADYPHPQGFAKAIQAILKEKNND